MNEYIKQKITKERNKGKTKLSSAVQLRKSILSKVRELVTRMVKRDLNVYICLM